MSNGAQGTMEALDSSREEYARFDRLPKPLRDFYNSLPAGPYRCAHATALIAQGKTAQQVIDMLRPIIDGRTREQCARLYGPDHPYLTNGRYQDDAR